MTLKLVVLPSAAPSHHGCLPAAADSSERKLCPVGAPGRKTIVGRAGVDLAYGDEHAAAVRKAGLDGVLVPAGATAR